MSKTHKTSTDRDPEYLTVAEVSGIPREGGLTIRVNLREIALFQVNGEIYALDDHCPHRGASLGAGTVENGTVFCPMHGWQFDLKTGACLDNPDRPARCIPLRIVDGQIQVQL